MLSADPSAPAGVTNSSDLPRAAFHSSASGFLPRLRNSSGRRPAGEGGSAWWTHRPLETSRLSFSRELTAAFQTRDHPGTDLMSTAHDTLQPLVTRPPTISSSPGTGPTPGYSLGPGTRASGRQRLWPGWPGCPPPAPLPPAAPLACPHSPPHGPPYTPEALPAPASLASLSPCWSLGVHVWFSCWFVRKGSRAPASVRRTLWDTQSSEERVPAEAALSL